jgi:NTE family protein
LTGGGARAAYQVGVLKGIAELLGAAPQPLSGRHRHIRRGGERHRARLGSGAFQARGVRHREGVARVSRASRDQGGSRRACSGRELHWMLALLTGGWLVHPPRSLFDNTPLWELLRKNLDFDGIPRGMYKQHLQAIGICATSYSDADSVTFYACAGPIEPWTRAARKGARVQLTLEHLMASLSIPFLFRPIFLHQQYFGDGAMRQTSPLSPAIHLGANRLLVIGVGDASAAGLGMPKTRSEPTFGQMFGFMLDSLFMDQLHSDLERIHRLQRACRTRAHRDAGAHAVAGSERDRAPATARNCRAASARSARDGRQRRQHERRARC